MSKFVEVNEKIAEGVVKGYKKIEDAKKRLCVDKLFRKQNFNI